MLNAVNFANRYWRIVDVDDSLEWGIFYYSGAASVVGQTYQVRAPCVLIPPQLL